ncbi:lecithin-cholesterol acyltransferase-like 1 [Panicum miliaceum]|uniref:Lecithin-cholesterol acyltransferase-like 1 n=1 Tax=Panicum miliaceum TaxID=4540 RepID=A0A3L6TE48_PANMI|nr:lecithin-cholesterol acyltransferase-like 1 [Panicum miliaceum]
MEGRPSLVLAPAAVTVMVMLLLSCSWCGGVAAARVVAAAAGTGGGAERHPVVLIPGAGGSQLEARLTDDYRPCSLACRVWPPVRGRGGWFRLWFDPSVLLAPLTRCFAERMMLRYDAGADDFRNAPGVETRVSDFVSTSTLRYLDPNLKLLTGYMNTLASTLEQAGYEEGRDLFGAPYDFRLGGLFALQLLARSPVPWRTANVARLVTLSAPWGGSVQEMLTFASGNTLGVPFVDASLIRNEQRTAESNLWLLPAPGVFGNTTLVVSRAHGDGGGNRSYSAKNMTQFLRDIGFEEGVEPPCRSPTCLVGTGVDTVESLVYGEGGFDEPPVEVVYGDGDGTVNLASLVGPIKAWADSPAQVVEIVELPGVSHSGILNDKSALEQIIRVIDSINLNATSYQTS